MPQLFDARGNEFQGALDGINNVASPLAETRTLTVAAGALNAALTIDLTGKAVALFEIRAAANSATYVFEGSEDGTNFSYTLPARSVSGLIGAAVVSDGIVVSVVVATTAAAVYAVNVTGFTKVRCRVSAYTSGSSTLCAKATEADYAIIAQPQPTLLWVTATAAAGTAITLTVPAAPGMFHYITYLNIMRATNVAEAAAAPLTITTTNLPGSPVWTVGAVVALGGQVTDVALQLSNPLKSLLVNTATTIIAPDPGVSAIWRLNCGYYLAL